jgi:hypothetical protein
MQQLTSDDKITIIEEVLDLFSQAAEMLRRLDDEYITRTVVAELEGREGGWCAHTSADVLRDALGKLQDAGLEEQVER